MTLILLTEVSDSPGVGITVLLVNLRQKMFDYGMRCSCPVLVSHREGVSDSDQFWSENESAPFINFVL